MAKSFFVSTFGSRPEYGGFTPGRVNLIGEHTDYNGGMVLPTALDFGVTIGLSPRTDRKIRVASDKFETIALRSLDDHASDHWSDYIVGAVKLAKAEGLMSHGADIAVQTNLPFGAGLSSSAAVIVGVLKLARDNSSTDISDKDIAALARRVENEFIGVPCGIMDQMAVAIARPGQALALQTDTLSYSLVDLPTDYHMAVIHSGVQRHLNEGRYKERKEECDVIKDALGHNNICQMTDEEQLRLAHMPDHIQRRARHCISEHRRTVKAIDCIRSDDLNQFGHLMIESHTSMRDDFEITVPAIDLLVQNAVELGALGARMTGGGFGGCIVACVPKVKLESWRNALLARHPGAYWIA